MGVVQAENIQVSPRGQSRQAHRSSSLRKIDVVVADASLHGTAGGDAPEVVQRGRDGDIARVPDSGPRHAFKDFRHRPLHVFNDASQLRVRGVLELVGDDPPKVILDQRSIVLGCRKDWHIARAGNAGCEHGLGREVFGEPTRAKEGTGGDGPAKENVVVEIHVALTEPRNPVQLRLNRVGVKRLFVVESVGRGRAALAG